MDSREITPELTRAVIHLAGEVRSFRRAEIATGGVLGQKVSRSTIRRVTKQVGQELADGRMQADREDEKQVVVPEAAVVSCDGGRIRTREPGQGRGVIPSGENGWRETKNSSFERMALNEGHSVGKDPCPELPTSFRTVERVAEIAEKAVPQIEAPADGDAERVIYEGPNRVLRTVISSMASSDEFGPMMQQEARRRRFYEARLRAFLGDGLNWNWSIWKTYFRTFVPILDFIHAIQYLFSAAMALGLETTQAWYRRWTRPYFRRFLRPRYFPPLFPFLFTSQEGRTFSSFMRLVSLVSFFVSFSLLAGRDSAKVALGPPAKVS